MLVASHMISHRKSNSMVTLSYTICASCLMPFISYECCQIGDSDDGQMKLSTLTCICETMKFNAPRTLFRGGQTSALSANMLRDSSKASGASREIPIKMPLSPPLIIRRPSSEPFAPRYFRLTSDRPKKFLYRSIRGIVEFTSSSRLR